MYAVFSVATLGGVGISIQMRVLLNDSTGFFAGIRVASHQTLVYIWHCKMTRRVDPQHELLGTKSPYVVNAMVAVRTAGIVTGGTKLESP
jgi:hypothetical protein